MPNPPPGERDWSLDPPPPQDVPHRLPDDVVSLAEEGPLQRLLARLLGWWT